MNILSRESYLDLYKNKIYFNVSMCVYMEKNPKTRYSRRIQIYKVTLLKILKYKYNLKNICENIVRREESLHEHMLAWKKDTKV